MGALGDALHSTVKAVEDAVNSVFGIGGSKGGGGTAVDLAPEVQQLAIIVGYMSRILDDVFNEADGLAATGVVIATDAGADIRKMAGDTKFAIEHTYKTVLPGTVRFIKGDITLHLIDPLRKRVTGAEHRIKALETWRADIHTWRTQFVDPNINDWRGFHKWFNTWPTDALNTLHQWLQHPSVFGDFAAPAVANPLVSFWSMNEHRPSLDNLLTILLDASPDRYRHAVGAFETMLDQEWP